MWLCPAPAPCPSLSMPHALFRPQIVSSASTDLQDYTYYFVPAPWLSVKLLRLLQCYPPPGTTAEPTRAGTWGLGPGVCQDLCEGVGLGGQPKGSDRSLVSCGSAVGQGPCEATLVFALQPCNVGAVVTPVLQVTEPRLGEGRPLSWVPQQIKG